MPIVTSISIRMLEQLLPDSSLLVTSAGVTLIAAALGLIWWQSRSPVKPEKPRPAQPLTVGQKPNLLRPRNQLPILDASELFARTQTQGLVETIRTRMGLSPANFEMDVLPVLRQYAEYVQLLPASESHHHAQPGGLLQHTLEVASNALAIRQGYKLPTGGAPEEQIRQAPVWSFGVLIAALLHDIGKPVADVVVALYGNNLSQSCGNWNGLVGPMREQAVAKQAGFYTVKFPPTRDYEAHQRLPMTLLHAIIPPKAMQWLGSDTRLLQELLAYLDSNDKVPTVLKEIITKADSLSVADNLKNGLRVRFASARNPPLIERLMQGLRTLLSESHLAINRPGAPVFIDPDGVHLWIVAGTAADQVRKILEGREERTQGAAGIPTDNTRLFDTWAEYGALVPPPKQYGKGSVWWVKFQIDDWSHVLTVLKFRVKDVYADDAIHPAKLLGSATPVEPSAQRSEPRADHVASTPTKPVDEAAAIHAVTSLPTEAATQDTGLSALLVGYDSQGNALAHDSPYDPVPEVASTTGPGSWPSPQAPAVPYAPPESCAPVEPVQPEFLDATDSALAIKQAAAAMTVPKTVQAFTTPKHAPRALFKLPGAQNRENAERFMKWIQQSLGDGQLTYNESDAVVHFVPEGMALVTPKIFRLYLETNEFIGDMGTSPDALRALQKEVQKGGYIARNAVDKSSFYSYNIKQSDGTVSSTKITTYLVPNPQAYVRPVPSPNPLLVSTHAVVKKPDASPSTALV
jgi:integrating conjugative element relaxase (TIGR03760 family)